MPRILMIDDDKDLLRVTQCLLEERGFKTETCSDWGTATRKIMTFDPNLILLDVFLDHTDGFQICNKLKSSRFTRHIPILVLSGFSKLADSAINEFGADGFLAKPFKVNDIISKMRKILARRYRTRTIN